MQKSISTRTLAKSRLVESVTYRFGYLATWLLIEFALFRAWHEESVSYASARQSGQQGGEIATFVDAADAGRTPLRAIHDRYGHDPVVDCSEPRALRSFAGVDGGRGSGSPASSEGSDCSKSDTCSSEGAESSKYRGGSASSGCWESGNYRGGSTDCGEESTARTAQTASGGSAEYGEESITSTSSTGQSDDTDDTAASGEYRFDRVAASDEKRLGEHSTAAAADSEGTEESCGTGRVDDEDGEKVIECIWKFCSAVFFLS